MENKFEYNKLCAEFLGWKECTEEFKINWVGCKTSERLAKIDKSYVPILEKNGDVIFPDFSVLNFAEDYRLIMEVIECIEKIGETDNRYGVLVEITSTYIRIDDILIDLKIKRGLSKKEGITEAIYVFLKKYKQNK